MSREYVVKLVVSDPDITDAIEESYEAFHKRLQRAMDNEWPLATLESVRITWVVPESVCGT